MSQQIKFDLGGIGPGRDGYLTVNLAADCDIKEDITALDNFCQDNSVDEFFLSHTLEHIPVTQYQSFLTHLKTKLKPGGKIKVIQTDAGRLIHLWTDGKLDFRSMRSAIFTPASRAKHNVFNQHQNMWTQQELIKDFESIGMQAQGFDAGSWPYDIEDDILPNQTSMDYGKPIPNLGVIAVKSQ